eukprot:4811877-Alexandrium_andersonii.AAC.1
MPGLAAALLPAAARPSNELHLVEVVHRARSPCGERACQQCRLRPGIGRILHDLRTHAPTRAALLRPAPVPARCLRPWLRHQ